MDAPTRIGETLVARYGGARGARDVSRLLLRDTGELLLERAGDWSRAELWIEYLAAREAFAVKPSE